MLSRDDECWSSLCCCSHVDLVFDIFIVSHIHHIAIPICVLQLDVSDLKP